MPVSTTEAAELVKLLENTFRSVNIGLVNEMAIVCDKLGVDVWEVIEAAATKPFGFMKFLPGPGLGGHCIPHRSALPRVEDAGAQLQDPVHRPRGRAQHRDAAVLGRARSRRRSTTQGKAVSGATVLVLGVAYKRDIDDIRESPALDIIRLLEGQGARVSYSDPHVPCFSENGHEYRSVPLDSRAVAAADCVMVVTDHTDVDYRMVATHAGWWWTLGTRCRKRRDMHVAVIGSGYVGLVAGACLAETGNDVVCVDKDAEKIARLQRNEIPIYEPGLEPMVQRNQAEGRLTFTTDIGAAVRGAKVVFIAVGTPPGEDGSADLQHVLAVAREIGRHMNEPKVVVTKSTVPVGTAEKVRAAVKSADRDPVRGLLQPRVPEGRGRDRGLHEARPRGHRRGRRRGPRGHGRAVRARSPARAATGSSSWTSPRPRSPSTPPTRCSPPASRS